jgi:hypothetical protein
MSTGISKIGLLVLMAAFVIGTSFAIRGGRHLDEAQRRELAAESPSLPGMAVLLALLACVLFARSFALYSAIAATALTALCAYIMVPIFNRQHWPLAARRSLVWGNSLLWLGSLSFVLLTAAGLR